MRPTETRPLYTGVMRSLVRLLVFASVAILTTPAHAQHLPATVAPEHYSLAFTVDLDRERFSGVETIRVRIKEPTSEIILNAVDLQFQDATVVAAGAGLKADVSLNDRAETATLRLPRRLRTGTAEIRTRFTGTLNDKLRGFYLSKTAKRKYAVTQFESTDARRAFPCFDEPALKATFALTLTIDRGDVAISNGKMLADTPGPGPTQHTVSFATSPKMSSYLVAMAVGDFRCLDAAQDGVPIRVCATPDKIALGSIALDAGRQILKFYNSYYAIKYPFGKLDLVGVPDFAAGAMENTAAIFFREQDLLADDKTASVETRKDIASTIAHEMAHQWFGDLVTMQWWDDLWLNEGFATWMQNHPLAPWKPDWNVPVDESRQDQQALALDSLKSTHPIHFSVETPAEIEGSFDAIAYQKGAAVLRMIEGYVGAETFKKGVNAYLKTHAYGNATSEDFWKAIASASGQPVDRILPTFLHQPGVPLVELSLRCENNQLRADVHQERFTFGGQESESREPAPVLQSSTVWQIPLCTKAPGASAAVCPIVDRRDQVIDLARGCPPWVFVNAGAHGYYRTAYPSAMLRAMAPAIQTALTPPERLSLVEDSWALVRAGRNSAADYLTIASGFGREQTSGVLSLVTQRLSFIDEYLTPAAVQPKLRAWVRSLLWPSFDALGIVQRPSDGDDRRALRAVVITALGTTGGDSDVIAQARAAVDRALAGGAPLEPDTALALIEVAATHGDPRLFEALWAAAERTSAPDEHYRYLNALAMFREPALVERALGESLSPRMRSQDTALYLSRFFFNPAARDRVWAFVKEHWSDLEAKLRISFGEGRVVSGVGAFCDARTRDDVRAFFAAHPLSSAVRTLDTAIERIDNCIAIRDKQTPLVTEWLATGR